MKKIIIFGTGNFARLASYFFQLDGGYEVAAITADREYVKTPELWGLPLVPFNEAAEQYPPMEYEMFVAVGYSDMNRTRQQKCHEAMCKGYNLASYVSPRATVFDNLKIGCNCFIGDGNIVQPFVSLGEGVVLMGGNFLAHHAIVDDYSLLTAGAVICGSTHIKNNCFIGAGAIINDGLTIAPFTVVGAAAYIARNTKENGVYLAEPARRSRLDRRFLAI